MSVNESADVQAHMQEEPVEAQAEPTDTPVVETPVKRRGKKAQK